MSGFTFFAGFIVFLLLALIYRLLRPSLVRDNVYVPIHKVEEKDGNINITVEPKFMKGVGKELLFKITQVYGYSVRFEDEKKQKLTQTQASTRDLWELKSKITVMNVNPRKQKKVHKELDWIFRQMRDQIHRRRIINALMSPLKTLAQKISPSCYKGSYVENLRKPIEKNLWLRRRKWL